MNSGGEPGFFRKFVKVYSVSQNLILLYRKDQAVRTLAPTVAR
ncbi:hypothetical protein LEP1GSC068_3360 [Leptospira sp. Fiocruz LV3954]|nr:hypothetical protein LEP1GSC068_3360 [Leptospira sp. Fiocruz LV3954]EMI62134.1 hypothetical protein LEP1GSC076_3427 [Leptospira sp. Fiocruz LV4135]